MLYKNCISCGKTVSRNCKLGHCNKCRDRRGAKNPFYGKTHKKESIEIMKAKLSESSKELWRNEVYRKKVISGVSKPRRFGFKKEQSERIKKWYINNPEQRALRSAKMKESWRSGKIEPMINSINESKMERSLMQLVKKRLPNEKITKRTIRINDSWFYPDILIGKYFIVEFYGDYWHANPNKYEENDIVHHKKTAKQIWEEDKARKASLELAGYTIFIVWQNDYENNVDFIINNLINKVNEKKNNS